MPELSHFDDQGNARMVDIGEKPITRRMARARSMVRMQSSTADRIRNHQFDKGDVLGVARIAGIGAAKWTPHLVPMCHSIAIESVQIDFNWVPVGDDVISNGQSELSVVCTVFCSDKTGVEMEALTAASVAALTIYDMCKSADREMEIKQIQLIEKTGGKSGHFVRQETLSED